MGGSGRGYDGVISEAIAFDTHRFVKNLTASGFTETQAEALADEGVRSEVQKARVGLARWMLTGWVAQSGLLATLFWYFSSGPPGG